MIPTFRPNKVLVLTGSCVGQCTWYWMLSSSSSIWNSSTYMSAFSAQLACMARTHLPLQHWTQAPSFLLHKKHFYFCNHRNDKLISIRQQLDFRG